MRVKHLALVLALAGLASAMSADTLRLKDGSVVYGTFNSRTPEGIQFTDTSGNTILYLQQNVASLTFGPIPAANPHAQMVTIPAGTTMMVRMVDTLDTATAQQGQSFSATLAANLGANGYVVAHRGTPVYGQVLEVNSAGRLGGTSRMSIQLTQIVIGGNATPIITDTYDTQGKSSTKRSFFRLLGGAGLGAAIGAIAGNAGMGAAIGGVAGGTLAVVQRGNQVQIPSEALLQFVLEQDLTLPALP